MSNLDYLSETLDKIMLSLDSIEAKNLALKKKYAIAVIALEDISQGKTEDDKYYATEVLRRLGDVNSAEVSDES